MCTVNPVFFAAFFQGLLTVQAYNYFENFPNDPKVNKIIVSSSFASCSKNDFEVRDCLGGHRLVRTVLLRIRFSQILILNLLYRTLDTMHLGFICQSVYHYLVTNWGFAPALMHSTWQLDIQLILIGLSCFVCQLFFLNRCILFQPKRFDTF